GKLVVKGDYRIQYRTEDDSYTYSSGYLKMVKEADYIIVEGDFFMDSYYSHNGYLTAGTLELKDNFVQKSTTGDGYKNFNAGGTHKVLLSGTGPQAVSFENASSGGGHFNELLLTTNTLKTFTTKVAVTKLFNHQRNPFILTNEAESSFVDYDGDGIQDHLDSYPLDPNQSNSDRDNDGVPDDKDAFPDDPTESVDSDNDGIGNNTDTDDDNDGIADTNDAFPLDASEWTDTDNDGQGDNADIDNDNDNVIDEEDNCPLIANPDQEDENGYQDGDNIGDACEEQPKKSMMCFPVKAKNGNVAIICL
ncbi:thrombospondin type 3 repeat-containing protein, partial [Desulfobulbus sp. TB]|nr:thrombospondin type 3 repeat-containing protein [Desulfobulbus sp. TB]